jgi:hypothetical protein
MESEYLLLKWGTLKGGKAESEKSREALGRYLNGEVSMSAMAQRDTDDQKQAIYDLIDAIDGPITNDWSGESMTKEAAKKYVKEYGQST